VALVLEGVPVGQAVDHVGDGVEVLEGEGVLGFVRREEVRGEFADGVDEREEVRAHAVVGVVGGVPVAEGEGLAEGVLVAGEDGQGGVDGGSRGEGGNFGLEGGVPVAEGLEEGAHAVGGEGLEEAREGEGSAGCVDAGAGAFDVAMRRMGEETAGYGR
jgi:hypothetical protein